MKVRDLTYLTMENFKNRRSRVILTVFGVAVAIAVVLSLVSFGYGLQKSLIENITTADSLLSLDVTPSDSSLVKFDSAAISKIAALPEVAKVSPQAVFNGRATYNGTISQATVNVVDSDFFILSGKQPTIGKFFTDGDSKGIVISSVAMDLFNLTKDNVLGKSMTFTVSYTDTDGSSTKQVSFGEDFKIIGVLDGGSNTADVYFNKSDFTFAPITTYQFAKVKVKNASLITSLRTKLINQGYIVSSLSDIVDQANKIFEIIQIALGTFGTFALFVAAVGLVNTMTISLLERTSEIGIMRAIGASEGDIRAIFLIESVMIGLLGGISGVTIGIALSESINWLFDLLAKYLGGAPVTLFDFPIWFILFICTLSTFVGLVGGMWPATRASKMNPLEALRYK